MTNCAPVLIMTLNRYTHLLECVESLSACTDSDKTDLYIAFDYPSKEEHWSGYREIEKYLEKINAFKNVIIIRRNKNYGAFNNYFDAQAEIFKKYDRIIVSEDDNVFAPSFLTFVNKGLSIYENREDIFAVSGYNYPLPLPAWYKHDMYLKTAFAGWGVGLWRHKWNRVDWSLKSFNIMLSKEVNYKRIKQNYRRYYSELLNIRDSGVLIGDYFLFLYMIDNNMYSVLPVKSRVRNIGHDGSGVHKGFSEIYRNQKIYEELNDSYFPPDLQPDQQIIDHYLRQSGLTFAEKLKAIVPHFMKKKLRRLLK
jgi:hypothetical protein